MKSVQLGDIVDLKYGKSLAAGDRSGSGKEVYGSGGVVGYHSASITDGPTVVVGRKGSIGSVYFSESGCWPIDTAYFVDRTCTEQDLRWIYFLLAYLPLQKMNKSAAIPGLNRDDVYKIAINLPGIDEQRRIAEILDKADVLRAKRREAIAHLDALGQSIFLEMFGDSQDWPVSKLELLAMPERGSVRTGPFGSQLLTSEFTSNGVAVLGIDNTAGNKFSWKERRFISEEKYEQLKRYTVHPGDLIITIMGTLGRCAVVPDDIPLSINTKHLCCITLDKQQAVPEYVHAYFLYHQIAARYLRQTTKGSIMAGLNMGIIKAMPVLVPPLDLQHEFANRVAAVERLKVKHQAQLAELDDLFLSLQDRAFKGEI